MMKDPESRVVLITVHHLFYQTYLMPPVIRHGTITPAFGTNNFKTDKETDKNVEFNGFVVRNILGDQRNYLKC